MFTWRFQDFEEKFPVHHSIRGTDVSFFLHFRTTWVLKSDHIARFFCYRVWRSKHHIGQLERCWYIAFRHGQQRKLNGHRHNRECFCGSNVVFSDGLIDVSGDHGLDANSLGNGRSCLYVSLVPTSSMSLLSTRHRIMAKSMGAVFENQVALTAGIFFVRNGSLLNPRLVVLNWRAA
jgi:hypothetical protein